MPPWTGRIALFAEASGDGGRAIAQRLAARGWRTRSPGASALPSAGRLTPHDDT